MHRTFKDLLPQATGENQWVAAINADIRSFTSSMSGDPAETALYLQRVYTRILDNYFGDISFFKPTGDGLLLIVPFEATEAELARVTQLVVGDAIRLVNDFPTIVEGDKLVQFPHPKAIGIGLAAGSVSRLAAGDVTLDYTGRALNVASRLMDLARPSGVVVESTLDFSSLDPATADLFVRDHVYLKGVAEGGGVDIFYTREPTRIPDRYRENLGAAQWHTQEEIVTLGAMKKRTIQWFVPLDHTPFDRTEIDVRVGYNPYRSGTPDRTQRRWHHPPFEYSLDRGKPYVILNFREIPNAAGLRNLPGRETVTVEVSYRYESA